MVMLMVVLLATKGFVLRNLVREEQPLTLRMTIQDIPLRLVVAEVLMVMVMVMVVVFAMKGCVLRNLVRGEQSLDPQDDNT